jgi:hypothetical protein
MHQVTTTQFVFSVTAAHQRRDLRIELAECFRVRPTAGIAIDSGGI